MIELPEAANIAQQVNNAVTGKKITEVIAGQSPHKYAFFNGDPKDYPGLLKGKTISRGIHYGGMVEIEAGDVSMLFSDGVNLRYYEEKDPLPAKHQLLVALEDGSKLVGSVQMYGGLWAFRPGEMDNPYYRVAKEKVSPLSPDFNFPYFEQLFNGKTSKSFSAKALLATEQRIPGLGNGVLQDILWKAHIHPKKKAALFTSEERKNVFLAIKTVLQAMVTKGGRDTERDLFGNFGEYKTVLSKNSVGNSCPDCGAEIKKEAYMGGSIYYCSGCQKN